VLDRFAREGDAKATKALIKRMEAAPPGDSVARLSDARAIASAYLDLGDEAAAMRAFDPVVANAKREKRKSDAAFFAKAPDKFRAENALISAEARAKQSPHDHAMSTYVAADRRLRLGKRAEALALAHEAAGIAAKAGWGESVAMLLLELGDKKAAQALWASLEASERDEASVKTLLVFCPKAQVLATVKASALAAMSKLVPSEWNLHFVMSHIDQAFDALRLLGRKKDATVLLDVTLMRMNTGNYDSRRFASFGAYLSLARMVGRDRGWPQALALLERALTLEGTPRQQALRQLMEVALELEQTDQALVWSQKLGAADQAKVHFARKDWGAMRKALKNVTRPADAAKLAWDLGLKSVTSRHDHCAIRRSHSCAPLLLLCLPPSPR
jgi:tetratricopeptide (TPR) repeat protein